MTISKYFKAAFVLLLVLVLALYLWYRHLLRKRSLKRAVASIRSLGTSVMNPDVSIFVSVPSYRDPDCLTTIIDCFKKARFPQRIFVGVCEQNDPRDLCVMDHVPETIASHVRVFSVPAEQAKGPMWARAVIETKLLSQERYFLGIDSHTLFAPGWDSHFVSELARTPDASRAVLTMYPLDWRQADDSWNTNFPSYLRFKQWNPCGLPEIEGPVSKVTCTRPFVSLFWGGCCSFSESQVVKRVPTDPFCDYVFFGEEIAKALRYFSHGYNLFGVSQMLLAHKWARNRPVFWEQIKGPEKKLAQDKGYRRIRSLFGLQVLEPGDFRLGPYGLGPVRSLAQFENFVGISFLLQQVSARAKKGLSQSPSREELLVKAD